MTTQDHLESVYEQGAEARRLSPRYSNPYPNRTPESMAYYEGWCWKNFCLWNAKHGLTESVLSR